uniref:NADH-ubiquinone oxidoreductase chain 4 n=1 Tax=Phloiophilus edwardsi TaxID=295730 RepID=A0A0S2MR79_9CUCU|nr:NADH deshydrogenase subunit 4 [Phloiophilus edwardsi]
MMKVFFLIFCMMPLCFLNVFWLIQGFMFILMFILLSNFSFNYMYMYISYSFGMDLMSYIMVLLTVWICGLMLLASMKLYTSNYYSNYFLLNTLILMLVLILTFSSMNLFIFYLFFEVSLIPVLMLILGWGYQPERIQAGFYLMFYTLFASLPMMVMIFYCYELNYSLDFSFMDFNLNNVFMYMCMNTVFFIKMPMFFLHLWLPKAHVEAPVSGSMILAGIMLKLGGYGLMRLMYLYQNLGLKINYYFIVISLVGGVIISLISIRQSDLKSLIAYSSVSHMGLTLSGIMTLNYWGFSGAFMMMIAHGLCSSALFCLANISYERLMSRSMYLNKGLLNIMPSMSMWWFLFCACNMAAPPSLNLMSEIMLINSLVSWSVLSMISLSLMCFFSCVYSLYLYSFSQHGKLYSGIYSFSSGLIREYLLLFLHWLPLNFLIMNSSYLSLWL